MRYLSPIGPISLSLISPRLQTADCNCSWHLQLRNFSTQGARRAERPGTQRQRADRNTAISQDSGNSHTAHGTGPQERGTAAPRGGGHFAASASQLKEIYLPDEK